MEEIRCIKTSRECVKSSSAIFNGENREVMLSIEVIVKQTKSSIHTAYAPRSALSFSPAIISIEPYFSYNDTDAKSKKNVKFIKLPY